MSTMTQIRGSSNALAKRELDWEPSYRSWREGFRFGQNDATHTDRIATPSPTVRRNPK